MCPVVGLLGDMVVLILGFQGICILFWAPLLAQIVKNSHAMKETQIQTTGWEDPLEKEWLSTPVLLPGKYHGQRSLVGYSHCFPPWLYQFIEFWCFEVFLNSFHLSNISNLFLNIPQDCASQIAGRL